MSIEWRTGLGSGVGLIWIYPSILREIVMDLIKSAFVKVAWQATVLWVGRFELRVKSQRVSSR